MSRIGDRDFLHAWQIIRAATQPGPEAMAWQVAGAQWRRHRSSLAAPDHALAIEVHRLDHTDFDEPWSLMVVAEHWWDERRNPLRNHVWATYLSGSRQHIVEWIERQAAELDVGWQGVRTLNRTGLAGGSKP